VIFTRNSLAGFARKLTTCETNLRQQRQPDEEKNWERQFLALLTSALMADPFLL